MEDQEKLVYRGYMEGHGGWVTAMQVGVKKEGETENEFLITGSRDKSLIIWSIEPKAQHDEDKRWGYPRKVLKGHSHFIEDIALSQDSRYCLSASWDSTMRLWDLEKFKTTKRFQSHNKDVLTCSFSADNRQISSGGRDHKLKVWNVVGECKYTVDANTHTDWVSAVRYSPDLKTPIAASASWDHTVKVWDSQTMQLKNTFVGHTNAVTTLDFAAAANFLASGGKDNKTCLWNTEKGELLKYKEFSSCVNQVLFSPKKYWLAIATDSGIYIWNLPADEFISKLTAYDGEEEEDPDAIKKRKDIPCTSIAWSKSGTRLYAGFADNKVRIYEVVKV